MSPGAPKRTSTRACDLPLFPPELREARGEFDWPRRPAACPKLVELADIRGDLHMHTTETDGKASLRGDGRRRPTPAA